FFLSRYPAPTDIYTVSLHDALPILEQSPVYGVLPYEPINALFSDYAHKKRFVWMPYNVKATYVADGDVLDFPTGSVLIKTFFYRSEEHTSELQSRENLVCRLLLEKK